MIRLTGRVLLLTSALLVTCVAGGCVSVMYPTHVKQREAFAEEPPRETVYGGLTVRSDVQGCTGLIDLFQPQLLDDFGERAKPKVNDFVTHHGFVPKPDGERAKRMNRARGGMNKVLQALGHKWRDPQGSLLSPTDLAWADRAAVGAVLDGDARYSVFHEVVVYDTGCMAGGVPCWVWPTVLVLSTVIDDRGRPVFSVQSTGIGDGAPLWLHRSPANFEKALDDALDDLESTKPQRF